MVSDLKEVGNNTEDRFLTVDELRPFFNYGIFLVELPIINLIIDFKNQRNYFISLHSHICDYSSESAAVLG